MRERAEVKRGEECCRPGAILDISDIRFLEYDDAVLTVSSRWSWSGAGAARGAAKRGRHQLARRGRGFGDQHATTAQITLHAISAAAGVFPATRTRRTTSRRSSSCDPLVLRANQRLSRRGGYYADVIIDVSDVVERKLAALNCIKSQAYDGAYAQSALRSPKSVLGASSPPAAHTA